ncbi:MAG: hypothetical protein M4D80_38965 [Myxococcota bacterium]|nr:hypothetical protein [Deltaproteobacteria bacterium]MDQ3341173.1 hypothetical protein [Myxococcota bacterium]
METPTQDPDRRVDEARESLLARVEELGKRLQGAKEKLDIPAHIAAHPGLAVGIALAAGALLGFPGKRSRSSTPGAAEVKSGLMGAAMATLGSLVFALAKNVAFDHLRGEAKNWWDRKYAMESDASRTSRDVDSFDH